MLFKGIEMFNFGRYAGKHIFNTTVTQDRNVIMVRASNDRGKTTLFKAIKYALYGEQGIQASSWINFQAAAISDGEMYVEIRFEHDGRTYRLKRSVRFLRTKIGMEIATKGKPKIELFDSDGPVEVSGPRDAKDWIDGVLPMDASQFFFFDGEEIQKYIDGQSAPVEEAVKKVLGIKELFNAEEDMREIKSEIDAEYSRNARKQSKNERERNKLDNLDMELSIVNKNIKGQLLIIKGAKRHQEDLKKRLQQYKSIENTVREREKAEREVDKINKMTANVDKVFVKQKGNLGIGMLASLLQGIGGSYGEKQSTDEFEEKTIEAILSRDKKVCICGRVIDPKAYSVLKSKTSVHEASTEEQLREFVQKILIALQPGKLVADLRHSAEEKLKLVHDMDAQQTVIKRCTDKINKSAPIEEMKGIEEQYEGAGRDIGRGEYEIQRLTDEKRRMEIEKEKMELRIEYGANDVQLKGARGRKDMCDSIIDGIYDAIEDYYEKRKPELENLISKIFHQLTNNPEMYKGIGIDRRFNLQVVRHDGTRLPTDKYSPSAGASQIVATAMIGGMNRFATKDAPIVIDTPLGRLDPIHRTNVMTYYAQMGKQIIILYQPSEIKKGDLEAIRDKLASEWSIEAVQGNPDRSSIVQEVSYL